MEDLYVLVTVYTHPNGRQIINTYGPYDRNQVAFQRRQTMRNWQDEVDAGRLVVTSSKVLDPERKSRFIWVKDSAK